MNLMLAEPTRFATDQDRIDRIKSLERQGWIFDTKWDGVRCVASMADGNVKLTNRNGVDITYRYPEVVQALKDQGFTTTVVLDGEVVAFGEGGPDFNRVSRRDRQTTVEGAKRMASQVPVVFIVFDVITWGEASGVAVPLVGRLAMLEGITPNEHLQVSPWTYDGTTLWQEIEQRGMEGLIAKDPTSPYIFARSAYWQKIKAEHHLSAVVVGYTEGKGSRKGKVGSLRLALVNHDGVVEVGDVGTGFTDKDLDHAARLLKEGKPFVVDVVYANFTEGGRLRFPAFRGFRTDIDPLSCTFDQIKEAS